MQALISLCDGEEDFFEGFFELTDFSEKGQIELIREVAQYDTRKLHCAHLRVHGVTQHYYRDELVG
jgi:hypothetical protein